MTKMDIVQKISADAKINKAAAGRALQSVVKAIGSTLKGGGKVSISGLGTFVVRERKARTGRNPRTGESINIPAKKTVRFRASKTLKSW